MTLRYKVISSSRHFLPGSAPQGVTLGVLLLIVKFNGAFLRPEIPRHLEDNCHGQSFTAKFVDDCSHARAVNLKTCLSVDTKSREHPVTFRQRTGHVLDQNHNMLQVDIDNFSEFTTRNKFVINTNKSSVMSFNFSKLFDFPPEIIVNNEHLEVVSQTKILGFQLSEDLKWDSHCEYICKKAKKKIWMLRRMMQLGLDYKIILDFYFKEIRSILEYGSVVFHSGLTKKLSDNIQQNQQFAIRLILGL